MKKILLTGANGFIGRHVLKKLLERDFVVHAITSQKVLPKSFDSKLKWHQANLLDFTQIKSLVSTIQPTDLLHFAWYAVHRKYWIAVENFYWLQASLELLKRFQEQGGQRVVMAGSCAEYDWNYGFCSESITPKNPATPYGTTKQAMQKLMSTYAEVTHLSSAWGRIFFTYGPFEPPQRLVASVIRHLLKNQAAPCSHGKQIRDFLYVQDVADAFVALLESEVTGTVNIASGYPVTLKEIINKIAEKIGRTELIQFGVLPATKEPPLLVADVTRLTQEVGWLPNYKLDKGLEETIQWWESQINK